MIMSSIALGAAGFAASLVPSELLAVLEVPVGEPLRLLIQLLGVVYLSFAFVNWSAREGLIGSLYSRPLFIGNSLHFVVGALVILKHQLAGGFHTPVLIVLAVYSLFAISFGHMAFGRGTAIKGNARDRKRATAH
jgi:hypothetical protein